MKKAILLHSFLIMAALATTPVAADIAWPSNFDQIVQAHMAAALPSGTFAAFGSTAVFDSKGTVAYASSAYGDAEEALDTVASVTRFTAGGNIATTPFAFCFILR